MTEPTIIKRQDGVSEIPWGAAVGQSIGVYENGIVIRQGQERVQQVGALIMELDDLISALTKARDVCADHQARSESCSTYSNPNAQLVKELIGR